MNLTSFYNHNKMMQHVADGNKIVNSTNFEQYKNERLNAINIFKIGQFIDNNGTLFKIIDIDKDLLICVSSLNITKTGKIKKNANTCFINPIHVKGV